jgi:pimeloyl-ACP methyl ester carboxylesterase
VNLEGMGLAEQRAETAPERYGQWLDEIRERPRLRDYESLQAVAQRLMQNNPRLSLRRAQWLAGHWAGADATGRYRLRGDPAHKVINPHLYRVDEVTACWARIAAPVLMLWAEHMDAWRQFTRTPQYAQRLAVIAELTCASVRGAGHMMHHDQPETVAAMIEAFLQ